MPRYAELQVTTNFSFLRGASHGEELVAQAKALGIDRARRHRPQHAFRRRARAHRGQGGGLAAHRRRAPRSAGCPEPVVPAARPRRLRPAVAAHLARARCAPRKANARSVSTMSRNMRKARSSSRLRLRTGTGARCRVHRHRRHHSVPQDFSLSPFAEEGSSGWFGDVRGSSRTLRQASAPHPKPSPHARGGERDTRSSRRCVA